MVNRHKCSLLLLCAFSLLHETQSYQNFKASLQVFTYATAKFCSRIHHIGDRNRIKLTVGKGFPNLYSQPTDQNPLDTTVILSWKLLDAFDEQSNVIRKGNVSQFVSSIRLLNERTNTPNPMLARACRFWGQFRNAGGDRSISRGLSASYLTSSE